MIMRNRMSSVLIALLAAAVGLAQESTKEKPDPIFSGPQVGEKLPAFRVRGVFDDDAGKELDFVKQADGKPVVLVFVHDVNRPSIGMTRALTSYTVSRAKDGLVTGVVWLDDDPTEAENTLKRIGHALTPGAPTGISLDGQEGPGSYGLNRNVTLTILVGKDNKVTGNFALVQPSLQADLPKILESVVQVAGGKTPKLEDIAGVREMMQRQTPNDPDPNLRRLLRPLLQKDATVEAVEKAAADVEEYARNNQTARKEIGRIANTVVGSGKLSDYGTARAQEFLKKWAKTYSVPDDDTRAKRENKK
jgi:hypothetical protein